MTATQGQGTTTTTLTERVPPDHGTTGLGLIMQLGGMLGIMTAAFVLWSLMVVFLNTRGNALGNGAWKILIVVVASGTRSVLHWRAGTALLYGGLDGVVAPVRKYVLFSFVHSVITLLLVNSTIGQYVGTEGMPWLALTVSLFTWPALLAAFVLAKPWAKELPDQLEPPEDRGIEAASILMAVLGAVGMILALLILVGTIQLDAGGGLEQILLVGLAGLLVARSAIHVRGGLRGLRDPHSDEFAHAAVSYVNIGMVTAVCGGAAFLIIGMSTSGRGGGGAGFMLAFTVLLVWGLMMWPRIIARFVRDRTFDDFLQEASAPRMRASDTGLTALGWLLLAVGAESFLMAVVALLGRPAMSQDLIMVSGLFGAGNSELGTLNLLLTAVAAGLQTWAGYELVHMTQRARVSATCYGAAGVVIAIVVNLHLFTGLDSAGADAARLALHSDAFMALAGVAAALVIPVASLLLARRPPMATARVLPRQ